ncbi:hypothetical protein IEQ34_025155 [Dendrobium chrysotoxum]|uniref:Pre-mRNA-splicing factor SLT11 n=1 Tax=Dendrobium chrysotoxum TaxID=161865 RepID=A0AAV7FJ52_DENCH|nr:hypothetical protein IEQ34_025155 [Dendrobium chrysotoxum]
MSYAYVNKQGAAGGGAEAAETPILCETCLGPNPYVRMSKQAFGKECKICDRPFTVFRWNPGAGMRTKKTEICTTCAKVKNVCQTCVLDLQFGLPVQVRDTALGISKSGPSTDINKQYYVNQLEANMDANGMIESSVGPSSRAGQEILKQLAKQRTDPRGGDAYRRNRAHLCSFYAKGECNRGDACPFRHELPIKNDTTSKQNIKDRFHGTNDPVARKILNASTAAAGLGAPDDKEITTLFLSALPSDVDEATVRTFFVQNVPSLRSDEIRSVTMVPTSNCAFVNFRSRNAAESAAERCALRMDLDGQEIRVAWGRSRPGKKSIKA